MEPLLSAIGIDNRSRRLLTFRKMMERTAGLTPILCAKLLRKVDARLIELLSVLTPEEWSLQTIAGSWTVREVAAHLLDTATRKLSLVRDSCSVDTVDIRSPEDLAALVHRLNREGVAVYRRLSPSLLIDLMEVTSLQSALFHESLDPFATATFPVSWAGEEVSLNWFDTARELTERWHHQQQIRLATNRPGIMTPELYHPVLDCFLRGLPHHFQSVEAPQGTVLSVEIVGPCGGQWLLAHEGSNWRFVDRPSAQSATSRVSIPQELAWRIFTKGISRDSALAAVRIEGCQTLGEKVLGLTAIVA